MTIKSRPVTKEYLENYDEAVKRKPLEEEEKEFPTFVECDYCGRQVRVGVICGCTSKRGW